MKKINIKPWHDVTRMFQGDIGMLPFYEQVDNVCLGVGEAMTGNQISICIFSWTENRNKLLTL